MGVQDGLGSSAPQKQDALKAAKSFLDLAVIAYLNKMLVDWVKQLSVAIDERGKHTCNMGASWRLAGIWIAGGTCPPAGLACEFPRLFVSPFPLFLRFFVSSFLGYFLSSFLRFIVS